MARVRSFRLLSLEELGKLCREFLRVLLSTRYRKARGGFNNNIAV